MAEQQPVNQEEGGKQKKGKGKVAIIILLIVIIIALGVIIFLLLRKKPEPPAAGNEQRGMLVDEENMEAIAAELDQPNMDPQTYDVTMNSSWTFQSGGEASDNAYVENSTSNQNDVYFDVTLADTGETILESPVIPVGKYMDNIKLDKKLPAGTYDCVMTYHLLDDQQNSLSTVKLALTIYVLS